MEFFYAFGGQEIASIEEGKKKGGKKSGKRVEREHYVFYLS